MKHIRYVLAGILLLATLLLSSCEDPAAPTAITGNIIAIDNFLLSPVTVRINGVNVGVVPADTIVFIQRGWLDKGIKVDWQLVQSIENGKTLGDSMGGTFTDLGRLDGDTALYVIDNIIGSGVDEVTYFAPHITNATTVPVQIGVNMDLSIEQRTDVIVAGGTNEKYLGYYLLITGSNVRVYRPEVAYSPLLYHGVFYGPDFDNSDLELLSGAIDFKVNTPPPRIKTDDKPAGMIASNRGSQHTQSFLLQAGQRTEQGYIWGGDDYLRN